MKLIGIIVFALPLFAQTTSYPGALDSDSSLFVVSDNVQTTLNLAMAPSDNVAIVKSGAGFSANMIVTICDTTAPVTSTVSKCSAWEHMLVTAVNGQSLTVTRGAAGTTARSHAVGAVISVLIDSVHQQALKSAVLALETALGPNLQATNPGPNWPAYSSNWAALSMNVNGYPPSALFGAGTASLPEAIRGAINIPANSSASNHGAGVAGYAMSASTTKGAVGVFGMSFPNSNGVQTWGANFVTFNCGTPWNCLSGAGLDSWTGYGIEIDTGVHAMAGGVTPGHFVRGVYIVNGGDVDATGYAFDADSPVKPVTMSSVLHSSDGFAATFAVIGTTSSGNNAGSQQLMLRSVNAGGTVTTSRIVADPAGNLVMNPGGNAELVLQDGAGNGALLVSPNGSTPYVIVPNSLNMGTSGTVVIPAIKSSTGQRYACVNTIGLIVSSAAACSGT